MNEQEIEKYIAQTDLALIRLAFCNASSAVLGELSHFTLQAAAQVDSEMVRKIRDMIKKGTANSTILEAVKQINETALQGCNIADVLGRIQKISTGNFYSISHESGCL